MGCGCGGSNRQVVPRRQAQRPDGPNGVVRTTRVNDNGTVWNGPDHIDPAPPAPSEPAETQPVEA